MKIRLYVLGSLLIVFLSLFIPVAQASTIEELQQKISELQNAGSSLTKQITLLNSQIALSTLKLEDAKKKIDILENEIGELNGEIDKLEALKTKRLELVLHRIPETYKRKNVFDLGQVILGSNFSEVIRRSMYLLHLREQDTLMYKQLQLAQFSYNERKDQREKKKAEQLVLKKQQEQHTRELDIQKRDKQILLDQTRNSEATYKKLLDQARAEQLAIQGIISGGGTEVQIGNVNEGDRIASVISGSSCNSSGAHLHFIVEKNNSAVNPFNYLKNVSSQNCSGYSCGSGDGDSFNPQGSWNWPIDEPIKFTQGYGETWAIKHTYIGQIYKFHNGIDINGVSLTVKSIQKGVLYRGFYSGGSGCRLQYVKVSHSDSDIKTYYLHVNY